MWGGRGGIPVIRDSTGITPVNGVIDKDATSALLGNLIEAQRLVILTDVEFVYRDYGRPSQEPIRRASAGELEEMLRRGEFQDGSMGPKVRAAVDFIRRGGGKVAHIASLERCTETLSGHSGTVVVP